MNSQAGEILSENAPNDPLALTNQLCFSLSVASRMVVQSYRPILEPLGLTHPQYLVMLSLWGSSPRTVKDLSSELMQDSATLSPLLKRLESRGLICRDRDPENDPDTPARPRSTTGRAVTSATERAWLARAGSPRSA